MIDDTFEEIEDITNPLKNKIPQIIEYFVDFYGESCRERITQRLNDAIFVFVERNEKNALSKYFKERKDEIALNFEVALEKECGYDVVNDIIAQSDYLLKLISNLQRWRKGIKKEDIEEVYSLLDIVRDKNIVVDSPRHLEKLLNNRVASKEIYDYLDKIYNLYEKDFKEEMDYSLNEEDRLTEGRDEERLERINRRYETACQEVVSIKLFSLLSIPVDEKNIVELNRLTPIIIDKVFKDPKFYTYYDKEQYSMAFDSLSKMSLKKLTSEEVEKMLEGVSEEITKSVAELRDKVDIAISKTLSNLNDIYLKIKEEVVEGESYVKEINNFFTNVTSHTAGFNITAASKSDPNKTVSICCNSTAMELYDDVMIHEMGHIISAEVEHQGGRTYTYRTGITSEFRAEPYFALSNTPKSYKILNEVLNEYFTTLICKKMEREDFAISVNGNLGNGSSYRRAFPLIKDFLNDNLEFLKKCYIGNDYVALDNKFGRDNLRALSKLIQKRLKIEGRVPKKELESMKQEAESIIGQMLEYSGNENNEETVIGG